MNSWAYPNFDDNTWETAKEHISMQDCLSTYPSGIIHRILVWGKGSMFLMEEFWFMGIRMFHVEGWELIAFHKLSRRSAPIEKSTNSWYMKKMESHYYLQQSKGLLVVGFHQVFFARRWELSVTQVLKAKWRHRHIATLKKALFNCGVISLIFTSKLI